MTREEKITAVRNAVQTDATLIALLKLLVSANIINVPDDRLDIIVQNLGLNNGTPE